MGVGRSQYCYPDTSYTTISEQSRTLWDWLQLLIVPFMLAIGAFWLNQMQKNGEQRITEQHDRTEREIALDNQHEVALQAYIDRMSELLLEKKLRNSAREDEVRVIAWVLTMTTLPRLDATRKSSVLLFLHQSGLIEKGKYFIDLSGANLGGANLRRDNLSGANLRKTYLGEANLSGADLSGANLDEAILTGAKLLGAKLNGASLSKTELTKAFLVGASLSGVNLNAANMRRADLTCVNLSGANLSEADLGEVKLSGADLSRATMIGTKMYYADLGRTVHLEVTSGSEARFLMNGIMRRQDIEKSASETNGEWLTATVNFKRGANLNGADLSTANIYRANLSDTDLEETNLEGARLTEAGMKEATVIVTDLDGSNETVHGIVSLERADLEKFDLTKAFLQKQYGNRANLKVVKELLLHETILQETDLTNTNLTRAAISDHQLNKAKSLQGAVMPDGSKHS